MKKITLILMVVLTITACKKEKVDSTTIDTETNTGDPTLSSNCINLEGYYKISDSDIIEKAKWLKQNGRNVCDDTLKNAVLKKHKVIGTLSNLKGKYVTTWGKLKPIIGSYKYERYLNIEHNKEKIIGVNEVNSYIPKNNGAHFRFSAALINFLAAEYAKDENSEFQFSFANLDQKRNNSVQTVVVIQVIGNPSDENPVRENPYYDYSTDPKMISTDNIPL